MANIGSFKKSGNEFQGEIVTFSVQTKGVRIIPETNRSNDNAPSHRVYVGRAEIGCLLGEALRRGPRLPLGQAGRSFVHRADLRQPLRRRGRRRLHPHLVAASQAQRQLSRTRLNAPARRPRAGHFLGAGSNGGSRFRLHGDFRAARAHFVVEPPLRIVANPLSLIGGFTTLRLRALPLRRLYDEI